MQKLISDNDETESLNHEVDGGNYKEPFQDDEDWPDLREVMTSAGKGWGSWPMNSYQHMTSYSNCWCFIGFCSTMVAFYKAHNDCSPINYKCGLPKDFIVTSSYFSNIRDIQLGTMFLWHGWQIWTGGGARVILLVENDEQKHRHPHNFPAYGLQELPASCYRLQWA